MAELIRLTYASTLQSTPQGLRQDLLNILNESNNYNFSKNIHGVLLFGNNYFYQCLEGNKCDVEQLYGKILKDSRHSRVSMISSYPISILAFSIWQMKYVQLNRGICQFFDAQGMDGFNPYQLTGRTEDEFLAFLVKMEESSVTKEGLISGSWGSIKGQVSTIKFTMYLALGSLVALAALSYLAF